MKKIQLILLLLILSCGPSARYNNPTDEGIGLIGELIRRISEASGTTQKVVLTGLPSAITEGQTSTVQIKMAKAIESNLVISLTIDNPAITINGNSTHEFTFTPENATLDQSFTLEAVSDINSISETVNLQITGSSLSDQSFSISTLDTTSVLSIVTTSEPATITEGQSSVFQVKLSKPIDTDIILTITSSDPSILVNGANSADLTFTTADATIDQNVTLSVVADLNSISETSSISISGTGVNTISFSVSTLDITTIVDVTAPTFDGLILATPLSAYSVELTWNAGTDDLTSQSSLLYDVYISVLPGGQSFTIASYTSTAGSTSYTVTGLSENTTYHFVVRARDVGGNRDSNIVQVSATTMAAPVITGVTAPSGEVTAGDIVYITGSNFDPTASNNTVKLKNCTLTNVTTTATGLSAILPNTRDCESGRITVTSTISLATGTSLDSLVYFHNLMITTNTNGTISSHQLRNDYSAIMANAINTSFVCDQTSSRPVPLVADNANKIIYAGCAAGIMQIKISGNGGFESITQGTNIALPLSLGTTYMTLSMDGRYLATGAYNNTKSFFYGTSVGFLVDNSNQMFLGNQTVLDMKISAYNSFISHTYDATNTQILPMGSVGKIQSGPAFSLAAESIIMDTRERLFYALSGNSVYVYSTDLLSTGVPIIPANASSSATCTGATGPMYGVRMSSGNLYVFSSNKVCVFTTNETFYSISLHGAPATFFSFYGLLENVIMADSTETRILTIEKTTFGTSAYIHQVAASGEATSPLQQIISLFTAPTGAVLYKMYR